MCWNKLRNGRMTFGDAIYPDYHCAVCGGNILHPPPMPEWLDEMERFGVVRDPDSWIGRM